MSKSLFSAQEQYMDGEGHLVGWLFRRVHSGTDSTKSVMAKRAVTGHTAFFATTAEALAWLADDDQTHSPAFIGSNFEPPAPAAEPIPIRRARGAKKEPALVAA